MLMRVDLGVRPILFDGYNRIFKSQFPKINKKIDCIYEFT